MVCLRMSSRYAEWNVSLRLVAAPAWPAGADFHRIRAVHPTNSVKQFLDEILLWRVPDFLHVVAFRQIPLL